MSPDQLKQAAPHILRAMATDIGLIWQVVEKGREIAKSAQAYGELVPYETFRDEKVPSFDQVRGPVSSDPNSVLDSIFPEIE